MEKRCPRACWALPQEGCKYKRPLSLHRAFLSGNLKHVLLDPCQLCSLKSHGEERVHRPHTCVSQHIPSQPRQITCSRHCMLALLSYTEFRLTWSSNCNHVCVRPLDLLSGSLPSFSSLSLVVSLFSLCCICLYDVCLYAR